MRTSVIGAVALRASRAVAVAVVVSVAAVSAAAAAQTYVSVNAGGSVLRVRPASMHLISNENVAGLRWNTWGGAIAVASGTDSSNFPSAGHRKHNPVIVTLRRRKQCGSRLVYTYVHIHFTAGVPYAGMPHTINYRFGCPF